MVNILLRLADITHLVEVEVLARVVLHLSAVFMMYGIGVKKKLAMRLILPLYGVTTRFLLLTKV